MLALRTALRGAGAGDHWRTHMTTHLPSTVTALTRGTVVGVAALLAAPTASAQPAAFATTPVAITAAPVTLAPVPFVVGEELTYKATFGRVPAGTARMRVEGIELVRGRPAYHVVFTLDGGVPFFRIHDRYESWIDVQTLASLRYRQQVAEGRYKRTTTYEIYPERAQYQKDGDSLVASVGSPLDDGSFLYAVRVAGVGVGETRREERYFKPDRNPVVLTGLRRDTVTVGAGTFATTVVRPTVRTKGIFSEDGEAQVWFSDDAARYPVQVKAKFAKLSLSLTLQSVTRGVDPSAVPGLLAAASAP
jgi:hypothetical protein